MVSLLLYRTSLYACLWLIAAALFGLVPITTRLYEETQGPLDNDPVVAQYWMILAAGITLLWVPFVLIVIHTRKELGMLTTFGAEILGVLFLSYCLWLPSVSMASKPGFQKMYQPQSGRENPYGVILACGWAGTIASLVLLLQNIPGGGKIVMKQQMHLIYHSSEGLQLPEGIDHSEKVGAKASNMPEKGTSSSAVRVAIKIPRVLNVTSIRIVRTGLYSVLWLAAVALLLPLTKHQRDGQITLFTDNGSAVGQGCLLVACALTILWVPYILYVIRMQREFGTFSTYGTECIALLTVRSMWFLGALLASSCAAIYREQYRNILSDGPWAYSYNMFLVCAWAATACTIGLSVVDAASDSKSLVQQVHQRYSS